MKLIPTAALLLLSLPTWAQTDSNSAQPSAVGETPQHQVEKTNKAKDNYPVGPYVGDKYTIPVTEERQAEEEKIESHDETRVNKLGPNKW